MDEEWERAVEAALRGGGGAAPSAPLEGSSASSSSPPRSLTLDGVIKCLHGRLPSPEILERYQSLQHLSIASIGVSSLERFPRLRSLTRLILSDNRISSGLEHLVAAGLHSLRDLDLSNNRIGSVEDLAPLARLRLVSLDLYECPVARVKDYRSRVFGLIRSLKYLDKMDADENERPESDEEEEDDEEEGEEEEDDEEDDPGSGEVDGDDIFNESDIHLANGNEISDGGVILNGDEDESEAEEEMVNGMVPEVANGFRIVPARPEEVDEDESDDEENLGEEIDEDEDEEEEDVVEVHDVSDDEDEEDDVEGEDEDDDGDGEEMDDGDGGQEIDAHERGEEEEDEDGELGEEENREGLALRQGFEEVKDPGAYDEENAEDEVYTFLSN
jgi:Leucine-rich repeat